MEARSRNRCTAWTQHRGLQAGTTPRYAQGDTNFGLSASLLREIMG